MKTYEIRYYFTDEDYITRIVNEVDTLEINTVLEKYTKGDHQTFPYRKGVVTRVNMNNVTHTKIWESKR